MPGPSLLKAIRDESYYMPYIAVHIEHKGDVLECLASADSLRDSKRLRLTCNPLEMQQGADMLQAVPGTPWLLDHRYQAIQVRIEPQPKYYPGGLGMNTDRAVRDHSARVDKAQAAAGLTDEAAPCAVPGKFWVYPIELENLYGGHVETEANNWKGIPMYPTVAGLKGVKVFQTRSGAHTGMNTSEVEATHEDYMMTFVVFYRFGMLNGEPCDLLALMKANHPIVMGPERFNPPPQVKGAPPVIHFGMKGAWVRSWQARLTSAGIPTTADGDFGATTRSHTRLLQKVNGLAETGIVDVATWEAAAKPIEWPELPTRSFSVMSQAQKQREFGTIEFRGEPTLNNPENIVVTNGWAKENIRQVYIPQLDRKIAVHQKVAHQFVGFFHDVEQRGLLSLIKSVDGFWVPRRIRGRQSLSSHAHGTAMDFNYRWNQLGREPAGWYTEGTLLPLVEIAQRWGFVWGGHFRRKDGGHFEVGKVLDK